MDIEQSGRKTQVLQYNETLLAVLLYPRKFFSSISYITSLMSCFLKPTHQTSPKEIKESVLFLSVNCSTIDS